MRFLSMVKYDENGTPPPKAFLDELCTSECLIDPWLGDVEARVLEEDTIQRRRKMQANK